MKKILIVVLIIIVLGVGIFTLYSYLDGFPIGISHGKLIIYHYTCADICPAYGFWQKQYYNVKSEEECRRIGGEPMFITYTGVVEHGYNGCSPTTTTTVTPPISPTADNFKKYSNSLLGIEFNYPKNFIPYLRDNEYIGDQPSRFTSGKDSYAPLYGNSTFVIMAAGLKEANLTIDQVAESSAQHKLRPFGENPLINKLEIEGQEARLIIPSDPNNNERELIVRLKNSVLIGDSYWIFLVIHASGDLSSGTIKSISESLRFL